MQSHSAQESPLPPSNVPPPPRDVPSASETSEPNTPSNALIPPPPREQMSPSQAPSPPLSPSEVPPPPQQPCPPSDVDSPREAPAPPPPPVFAGPPKVATKPAASPVAVSDRQNGRKVSMNELFGAENGASQQISAASPSRPSRLSGLAQPSFSAASPRSTRLSGLADQSPAGQYLLAFCLLSTDFDAQSPAPLWPMRRARSHLQGYPPQLFNLCRQQRQPRTESQWVRLHLRLLLPLVTSDFFGPVLSEVRFNLLSVCFGV